MKFAKISSVVVALHVIVLGFFFFRPPVNFFAVTCLSTIIVWPVVFSVGQRKRLASITGAVVLQLVIQQVAFHAWLTETTGRWWPLAQFLGLQYVVALRLGNSPRAAPESSHCR
jgi:predicted PurR-regulated permease PerM